MRLLVNSGFTLIEMIIVIVILSILAAMASSLISQGTNAYLLGKSILTANSEGQIAMQRLSDDLMAIPFSSAMTNATSSVIAFSDANGNTIQYALNGNDLTLTQNGASDILADGISNFNLTYLDRYGAATTTIASIRYIQVSFSIIDNTINQTLSTMIYPRNIK